MLKDGWWRGLHVTVTVLESTTTDDGDQRC